ncbi:hypothetical protein ACFQ2B_26035 [Streptomyces stramineus]|uniref:Holin n=1 Tax=Streptomyces stramineus TaxID=173861 RepID=A0ABP3JK28_9ACTN
MGTHRGPAETFPLAGFIRDHPARLYSVATAALTLVAMYVPDIPQEAILALVAAMLGVGEVTQRVENAKTAKALQRDT